MGEQGGEARHWEVQGALDIISLLELIWYFHCTNPCYRRPQPLVVPLLSSFGVTICGFIYLH